MCAMKKLLIIIDGMDDEPIPVLGNLTPAQYANMPALRYMRQHGSVSMQQTIPQGYMPGTEVAVMNILGCDMPDGFASRSWLEAVGCGINVDADDLCLRCNLISHSNGIVTSHCGKGVNAQQSREIVDILNQQFSNERFNFYGNDNFRKLLIVRGTDVQVSAEAPHMLVGQSLSRLLVKSNDEALAETLNRFIIESRRLLAGYPANGIGLWAPGRATKIPQTKINGALISGVNVVKGIGRIVGLDVMDVKGATGDENTDYHAKLGAALDAFGKYDFVLLHIEAPDEISHCRDSLKKVKVLEDIDSQLLDPILEEKMDLEITIQSDHGTSSITGRHLDAPVEVIKYKCRKYEK